ncbi:hypothetical protein NJLHNGOC_13655 [Novacetimonas cocois]|uniref:Uncharacterized protein n=2 Tax=Novacetimonas cocois TaxID=1747507 RepID=A0A365YTM4_9PROT|nr:hypothetical protein NJLHNGOC_13655 [Novacetimonas cocois]
MYVQKFFILRGNCLIYLFRVLNFQEQQVMKDASEQKNPDIHEGGRRRPVPMRRTGRDGQPAELTPSPCVTFPADDEESFLHDEF